MTPPTLAAIVENDLVQDPSSVWLLRDHTRFGYSDGAAAERYLQQVLAGAHDLGSTSDELQTKIRDWASEYHLSRKRSQLLSGFAFDRTATVLEVGCGCGAITRFLGETFDSVVSIEGSLVRARLAASRTRDLPSVSIVCAPFQEVRFKQRFDVIMCIGVFEYSESFVDAPDPYEAVLKWFSELLTPDGILVLAIENQFGLKYFNAAREDHLATTFSGIEGYHRDPGKARTFGRRELTRRLMGHFSSLAFYYPYPDYKIPDCIVSEEFLENGRGAEMVAHIASRDYYGDLPRRWNETLVTLELARNGLLPDVANSFLVIAGKSALNQPAFGQDALLFGTGRRRPYRTTTRVVRNADGHRVARKARLHDESDAAAPVRLVEHESPWMEGLSLLSVLMLRAESPRASIETIFEPARQWAAWLADHARLENDRRVLPGTFLDCTWSNVYLDGDTVSFVDREWVWQKPVPLNVVAIRAIYDFLWRVQEASRALGHLRPGGGARAIRLIASAIGLSLTPRDFDDFVALESAFHTSVYGVEPRRYERSLRWFLRHPASHGVARRARATLSHVRRALRDRLAAAGKQAL